MTYISRKYDDSQMTQPPLSRLEMRVDNHSTISVGPGFEVIQVTTGVETPWVFIGNVPRKVRVEEICRLFAPFGNPVDVKFSPSFGSSLKDVGVCLRTTDAAMHASAVLNGARAFGTAITARRPITNLPGSAAAVLVEDTTVYIEWQTPGRTAYCGYNNDAHAQKAFEAAKSKSIGDYFLASSRHTGLPAVGPVTIQLIGVPDNANDDTMLAFGAPIEVVWMRAPYANLTEAESGIRHLLEEFSGLVSFDLMPPPYVAATVHAVAKFTTAAEAGRASKRLHNTHPSVIGGLSLTATHVRSVAYEMSRTALRTIQSDIDDLQSSALARGSKLQISSSILSSNSAVIRLSSQDLSELCNLKVDFENIVKGEIVLDAQECAWDPFFSQREGLDYISRLQRQNSKVRVKTNPSLRRITIAGPTMARDVVRCALLSKIQLLRQERFHEIPLDGRGVGVFLREGLGPLREKTGARNVFLDPHKRTLVVRGADDILGAIEAYVSSVQQGRQNVPDTPALTCPVCFDQVTAPAICLPCGHSWCRSCLERYLASAVDGKIFPLKCLGGEATCQERIPLTIAQDILPLHVIQSVVHSAFLSYVHARPQTYQSCPTPDCRQVYRTAGRGTTVQCPSCLLRICPVCNVEEHVGFACTDVFGGDARLRQWVKEHDVKSCPNCRAFIERAGGCNHVTCTHCKAHICWVCRKVFDKGEKVYNHLRNVHGGIGLGPALV